MKKISDYIGVALIVLSIAILSVGLIWFASAFLLDYEPPLWCIVADVALFVIIAICYVVRDNAWRKERLDEEFALGCDCQKKTTMEVNKVRIQDWVLYKGIPCRINGIADNHFYVERGDGEIEMALLDQVEPIPLTPEILEKNGWRSRMNRIGEFRLKKPLVDAAIVTKTINGFCMNHGPFNGLFIHYVHELQEVLRLCDVNLNIVV